MRTMYLGFALVFSSCILLVSGAFPVSPKMKTIGGAIKGGILINQTEQTVFEYSGDPGVITEMWNADGGPQYWNNRMRIYIDGETKPSLDFRLFMAHGIGDQINNDEKAVPWGIKRVAHTANAGGLSNTYRIPFGKSIKITITLSEGVSGEQPFWFWCHGVTNYMVQLGDLLLPTNARLRLYKNTKVTLQPLQPIVIANPRNTAGAVFMVTLAASSEDFNYLEACFRAFVDGSETPVFLSSGTEDYFMSAYYFNAGTYQMENAGLTFIDTTTARMSAYKFHENDPLLFSDSLVLEWKCGEDGSCPNHWGANHQRLKLAPTVASIYVWVYEYTF